MTTTERTRRVALVTGCSEPGSLGASIALELLHKGFRVFATARKVSTMAQLRAEGCDLIALDVVDSKSIDEAVSEVRQATNGRLDILVNNAGVAGTAPILETDGERIRAMYEVNVFGLLAVSQAFAPLLIDTANKVVNGKQPEHSVILNVGSVAVHAFPWMGSYASSKAAAQTISDTMRLEMKNLNVKVITLELAQVHTAMSTNQKDFPVQSAKRSGYYANYEEIYRENRMDLDKNVAKAMGATQAAVQVVALLLKKNPPGKAWVGTMGWMFAWVWNLMPLSLTDNFTSKMLKADRVVRPMIQ